MQLSKAEWAAFAVALVGFVLATLFYGVRKWNPDDVRRAFAPMYRFLVHKWWFDELYAFLFVRPVLRISGWVAAIDKKGIDWLADNAARSVDWLSRARRLDRPRLYRHAGQSDGTVDLRARHSAAGDSNRQHSPVCPVDRGRRGGIVCVHEFVLRICHYECIRLISTR